MGVINKTTDEINTLLDKVANLPEEDTSGKDGKTPILETGTTTTLEAGSQATSEVVRNGEDASGNPKYKINFGIPRGQDGIDGGGVADSVEWDNVTNKPTWVTSTTKPTYTAKEVGALPSDTSIPTKTSELENDSNFTTTSSFKTINGNSILGEGNLEIASGGGGVVDSVEWNKVLNKPQWVISDTKPTYTASEVGAIATGSLKTINGESLEGEGNIEIPGAGSGIPEAPTDGKTYGRNNKKWVEITSSGGGSGSVQLADISDIYERYFQNLGDFTGTMSQEDFEILKNYATNKDVICVVNRLVGGNVSSVVNILYFDEMIFLITYDFFYGLAPAFCTYIIEETSLNYTTSRQLFLASNTMGEKNLFFKKYTKLEKYTPITESDSMNDAIGKLEAGISQGGGGGIQAVDITELMGRLLQAYFEKTTISDEDYALLEKCCAENSMIYTSQNGVVGRYSLTGKGGGNYTIMELNPESTAEYLQMNIIYITSIKKVEYYTKKLALMEKVAEDALLTGYRKNISYSPILESDSIMEAIEKLEAAVNELQKK